MFKNLGIINIDRNKILKKIIIVLAVDIVFKIRGLKLI